jgi:hypothetical protein
MNQPTSDGGEDPDVDQATASIPQLATFEAEKKSHG